MCVLCFKVLRYAFSMKITRLLCRVVVFIPLALYLLPVYYFAIGYGFGLAQFFIALFAFGIAFLHGFYRGIIKNMDYSTAKTFLQLFGTKGFTLYVKIGDVKIEYRA